MDFLDSIGNDAAQLAAAAAKGGSVAIQSDITGLNLTPVLQTQAIQQQSNSQLLFLLLVGFVIYKFIIK